jgi:hypothetical protein
VVSSDITGRVRAMPPPQLVQKTAEIDAALGHEVTFRVVDALYATQRSGRLVGKSSHGQPQHQQS